MNQKMIRIVFGLVVLLSLILATVFVVILANNNNSQSEEPIITKQELITDEELPIIAEEQKGTEEQPFFATPPEMTQENMEGTIYKFVAPEKYTEKEKIDMLGEIFGGGKYEKKETRENATVYESKDGESFQALVVTDSLLDYWTYYQPDNTPVLCVTNGGENPCPTDLQYAEKEAEKILKKLFIDQKYSISSYEGGGVYNIIVFPLLDNIESPPPFVFEYSPNGQLIYATGYFAKLEPYKKVDIVNPKTILGELNESEVWPAYAIEQTSIPVSEYATGDVDNRDSEDGTRVFIDKGIPAWKIYSSEELSNVYLVPSYTIVPSGKNRAWNVVAIQEQDLPKQD